MTVKERVYRLVEVLPEDKLPDAALFLESLLAGDPFLIALANAPEDDEPETQEEREAVAEGKAAYARGDWVADEDLDKVLNQ